MPSLAALTPALVGGLVALVVTLLAVPPIVRVARAWNFLDCPDHLRRIHRRAVPRLGGIAVWLGAFSGIAAALLMAGTSGLPASTVRLAVPFLVGLSFVIGVGLLDDLRGVPPLPKLVAQAGAAAIMLVAGFRLESVALTPELTLSLGWFAIPVTFLWIVALTNACNLIDGLDGLAGGVGLVALIGAMAAAIVLGHLGLLWVAVPLAGAVLGFLRYNISPAKIFLGDVGSMSLGFALAVLTIEAARAPGGAVFILVPVFAVAFPLLDTGIAMLRRWLRGVPLSSADGRHMHHQLVALGLPHGRAAALVWLFSSGMVILGLSISFAAPALTLVFVGLGSAVWLLLVIHGARWLHYHELLEAQASFASGLLKARSAIRERILARDLEQRISAASSLTEIAALLQQHSGLLGFDFLTVRRSSEQCSVGIRHVHAGGEPPRVLEWPVPNIRDSRGEYVVLTASWRVGARMAPLYAERVLRILEPSIARILLQLDFGPRPIVQASSDLAELSAAGGLSSTGLVRPSRQIGALTH